MKIKLYKNNFILLIALLTLPACSNRHRLTDRERLKVKIHTARLLDIPVPVGTEPIIEQIGDNSFAYSSEMGMQELVSYYMPEMEHHGWQLIGKFSGIAEVQIIFAKPHKLASIAVKDGKKQRLVLILTSDK